MTIDQCLGKRILVDTDSSINVLFKDTFWQMDIPWDKVLPYTSPLVGFTSQTIKSDGKISLPIYVRDSARVIEFIIVFAPYPYNCIMGRPALNQLQAKVSTCGLLQMIYSDQKVA